MKLHLKSSTNLTGRDKLLFVDYFGCQFLIYGNSTGACYSISSGVKLLPMAFIHFFFHQSGSDDRAVLSRLSTDEGCCVPAHITGAGMELESHLLRHC